MTTARKLPITALIVGLAMLLGGAVRIYRLADRPLTQTEINLPGLPPSPAPVQPLDLTRVVTSNLFHETDPPGYPLLMSVVTRAFGASLWTIRLPSVLFGVASIGLLYLLGLHIGQRTPGCIAALLLAFNGYHVGRSQLGDTYPLVCFLGLLATVLLVVLSHQTRRRIFLEFCYGAVLFAGLACHPFFWALIATQFIWVLANAWIQQRRLPRLLNIQILVTILSSPLLALARLQSLNGVAGIGDRFAVILGEYVQFFWILPGLDDIGAGSSIAAISPPTLALALSAILCLFCLWLLIVGFRQLYSVDDPTLSAPSRPFIRLWIIATLVATLVDIALEFATRDEAARSPGPWVQTLRGVEVLAVLPSILVMGAITLSQSWQHLSVFGRSLDPRVLAGGRRLILLQTFLPLALLTIASLFLRPLLNARGLLFIAPYLLLMLACGIFAIGRRNRPLAIAQVVVLAVLHAGSLWAYISR